jgi:cytochrome P450
LTRKNGADCHGALDFGFGVRRDVFYPLLGDGIFTQEGTAWKHSRELLRKQFMRTHYQNSENFREHVDNLLACLPTQKGVVDVQPLFFKLTLDTTTALLLGHSVHSLRTADIAGADDVAFAESFNTAQQGLARRFRIAPWHSLYCPKEFKHACSVVHKFVDNYISARKTEKGCDVDAGKSIDFFEQVAQESSSDKVLRDQLINLLLAGRDTAACCMSWTMCVNIPNPSFIRITDLCLFLVPQTSSSSSSSSSGAFEKRNRLGDWRLEPS